MKRAFLLPLVAAIAYAQTGAIERGAQLYRTECAIPYCHGPEGAAGRAPRLAGHHYNVNTIFKIISWGIPGTGMPEFTKRLKTEQMADLVAYVMTLAANGPAAAPPSVAPPRALTPQAKEGRDLFFDAARTGACGSCHELDGWGVPVGPDLAALPAGRFNDLSAVATHRVSTARPAGEPPFPALLVERTETKVRVYDLTAALPVLRTFAAAGIVMDAGTAWRHEQPERLYTTRELETIAAFLRLRASQ
jgi:mono/diheme cytochrome c family protein